ncbi:MAG: aspartate--ammonia ligase [Clostridiales bacterium]|jgi:aspartate--ammonia ligase|nr:aspartate--ammonia ligase [Clostridiales bacterium]MDN5282436.1 aspartate--ammonia ligase [Candidatus Ozemobacter sp.]
MKKLTLLQTEKAILELKRFFEDELSGNLKLHRVSAPMFVAADSGIQDNLNGFEKPVSFSVSQIGDTRFEIVHSLAKWKRLALARYQIPTGEGLYTDMNALRPDEPTITSGIHSVYVDQWDWEKAIDKSDRNLDFLKETVKTIYETIVKTEKHICNSFGLKAFLPSQIHFIHSEDLLERYPNLSAKERETAVCKEHKAVFIIGIGGKLQNGEPHDGRAPDYDDWTTPTLAGKNGLNGDILVYNPILDSAFEISSMGIRVDPQALKKQLKLSGCEQRANLPWHRKLLSESLPLSIGGGIGQSRLSMLILQKRHIGEVQVSVWPDEMVASYEAEGAIIL